MKKREINIGTLNVRGCKNKEEKEALCKDIGKYKLQVLGFTESHIAGAENVEDINIKIDNKTSKYKYYEAGIQGKNTFSGVGCIIDADFEPKFQRITDRICIAETKIPQTKKRMTVITAYAPTMKASEEDPSKREAFYSEINKLLKKEKKNKHMVVLIGDFNAKTGSGFNIYKENMGKYGKGEMNSNGEYFLNVLHENNMVITNTLFNHKMAHRTTWTAPERVLPTQHHDGTTRRNPFRNQIDYIMVKTIHKCLITDARSYGGTETYTDHKLVRMRMKMEWYKMQKSKSNIKPLNLANFNVASIKEKYKEKVREKMNEMQGSMNPNEKWNKLAQICLKSAEETIGCMKRNQRRRENPEIKTLSDEQKRLRDNIEASTSKENRIEMRKKRNKIHKKIKNKVKQLKEDELEEQLREVEDKRTEESKYYEAARILRRKEPKKEPKILNKEGKIATSDKERCKIVTEFFSKLFHRDNPEEQEIRNPVEMTNPFTKEEITKAVKKLWNNKSAGPDQVKADLIKNSPEELHDMVANILQSTSRGECFPEMLRKGTLVPLPKPPKKDAKVNVRPIILLSILRKLLSMCMIERCWDRMKTQIPIEQAAYQPGRSTTEQVFCIKTLAEKAITTDDFTIFILMLDMSKAFDSIDRRKLMEYLSEILEDDELYMLNLLINDVVINVEMGEEKGKNIHTNVGSCQGDCLSAIFFIIYLAKSIKPLPQIIERQDYDKPLWSELDWLINKDKNKIEFNPKYSDDINFIRSEYSKIRQLKRIVPVMLKENNLEVNTSKTEEYVVNNSGDDDKWKKSKVVVSGAFIGRVAISCRMRQGS